MTDKNYILGMRKRVPFYRGGRDFIQKLMFKFCGIQCQVQGASYVEICFVDLFYNLMKITIQNIQRLIGNMKATTIREAFSATP